MALSKNKLAKSSPIIKYAPGQSFSLLQGSWHCQEPFSCFGHYRLYDPKKLTRSSLIEKLCPWTKFQPPKWLLVLALSGPVFLFRPLDKLSLGAVQKWRHFSRGGGGSAKKWRKVIGGRGGVSQKVTILNKSYYITLHKWVIRGGGGVSLI